MPGAIKLMALRQVAPAFLRGFCRKVRIEIAIVTLRGGHQFNHLIGGFLKLWVGFLAQRPGNRFQPFRDVAVLKDHAVKVARLLACGNAEIFNGMAGFSLWNTIV